VQLTVSNLGFLIVKLIALKNNSGLITSGSQVPVNAVIGNVQRAIVEPANMQIIFVKADIAYLGEGFEPIQPLAMLTPETLVFIDLLNIQSIIVFIGNQSAFTSGCRHRVDLAVHILPLCSCFEIDSGYVCTNTGTAIM
jgi:hypothetical protein